MVLARTEHKECRTILRAVCPGVTLRSTPGYHHTPLRGFGSRAKPWLSALEGRTMVARGGAQRNPWKQTSTRIITTLLFFLFLASPLLAAEPTVRNLNVRGLQVGGTTTITVDGDDLGKTPKLLFPFPAKQTLKPGSTDKQATFEVALDDAITPGLYHLRVVTEGGASLPVIVGIDRLSHKPLSAVIDVLPAAVYGAVTGSTVVETTFIGKASEKITVEIDAQRLGSKLRPIVHLYGPKKLQLVWAWGIPNLSGDARLEATLPETGTYTITVHDAEYAGPGPGYFQLKVGSFGYVDQVFPPTVGKDSKSIELLGSTTSRVDLPPSKGNAILLPWPKVQVPAELEICGPVPDRGWK